MQGRVTRHLPITASNISPEEPRVDLRVRERPQTGGETQGKETRAGASRVVGSAKDGMAVQWPLSCAVVTQEAQGRS